MWPTEPAALALEQRRLAGASPAPLCPTGPVLVGGCFVCFGRGGRGPGSVGDRGWAAAAVLDGTDVIARSMSSGEAAGPYRPGLLALREGPLLEAAVRKLAVRPTVLLVNATGLDHPRRAGLALHLGSVLDLPTVGVTHRPLLAKGEPPRPEPGAVSPLLIGSEVVACWLTTRPGAHPLVIHAGWRTSVTGAVDVVAALPGGYRTPEPLREARHLARRARAESTA